MKLHTTIPLGRKTMLGNKPEIWIIDTAPWRRDYLLRMTTRAGFKAFAMEPDADLPEWSGRDVVAIVHDDEAVIERLLRQKRHRPLGCVVYADGLKASRAAQLLRRGVADLLDWPCQLREVGQAIRTATAGPPPFVISFADNECARDRIDRLSPREREVLAGVVVGRTNREIAAGLKLSRRTVEAHRFNLMRRLGVGSTAEAVRLAIDAGCLQDAA